MTTILHQYAVGCAHSAFYITTRYNHWFVDFISKHTIVRAARFRAITKPTSFASRFAMVMESSLLTCRALLAYLIYV